MTLTLRGLSSCFFWGRGWLVGWGRKFKKQLKPLKHVDNSSTFFFGNWMEHYCWWLKSCTTSVPPRVGDEKISDHLMLHPMDERSRALTALRNDACKASTGCPWEDHPPGINAGGTSCVAIWHCEHPDRLIGGSKGYMVWWIWCNLCCVKTKIAMTLQQSLSNSSSVVFSAFIATDFACSWSLPPLIGWVQTSTTDAIGHWCFSAASQNRNWNATTSAPSIPERISSKDVTCFQNHGFWRRPCYCIVSYCER